MNKIYFYVKALPVMVLSNFHRVTTTGSPSQILFGQHNCPWRVEPRLALVYFLQRYYLVSPHGAVKVVLGSVNLAHLQWLIPGWSLLQMKKLWLPVPKNNNFNIAVQTLSVASSVVRNVFVAWRAMFLASCRHLKQQFLQGWSSGAPLAWHLG